MLPSRTILPPKTKIPVMDIIMINPPPTRNANDRSFFILDGLATFVVIEGTK